MTSKHLWKQKKPFYMRNDIHVNCIHLLSLNCLISSGRNGLVENKKLLTAYGWLGVNVLITFTNQSLEHSLFFNFPACWPLQEWNSVYSLLARAWQSYYAKPWLSILPKCWLHVSSLSFMEQPEHTIFQGEEIHGRLICWVPSDGLIDLLMYIFNALSFKSSAIWNRDCAPFAFHVFHNSPSKYSMMCTMST